MRQFWLAFMQVQGIGTQRVRQLHEAFGDMERAWFASPASLAEAGLPTAVIQQQQQLRKQLQPDQLLKELHNLGAWVRVYPDEDYPALLRQSPEAPAVLYGRGELLPEDEQALAVVGTRRMSEYGAVATQRLVSELAAQGITIVSGLARGVDVQAHRIAMQAGGRTIAVLGTGIDRIYPSEHRDIAHQIPAYGAIVTIFPPGTRPERHNFPLRNTIISGLSLGTLVIEAPENSGALSTANAAGQQGREVFAVPGNITSRNSRGCHQLIQDGAKLVHTVDDILVELNVARRQQQTRQVIQTLAPETALEASILQHLGASALHVDDLSRRCEATIQEINATLTLMELKGMVMQIAPMTYQAL